jgi:two-component system KDP operon response regulator KdpE
MTNLPVVLIIDDEPQMRRLLQISLEAQGYKVTQASSGEEGITHAAMDRPEAIILDLGLPDLDGKEVLRRIREWGSMPILILSVRNAEQEIIGCLEAGADDYLTKPFRTGELAARLRTAMRHRQPMTPDEKFTFGNVHVDLASRVVRKGEETVKLTATEYSLLLLLIRNAGRVLTHHYILEQVWGPTFAEETQYSRVYIAQLRKKLEDNPARPRLIVTESGIGYRLATE